LIVLGDDGVLAHFSLLAGLAYWVELPHLMVVSNFLAIWNILVKRLVSDFWLCSVLLISSIGQWCLLS
jgi:hypothetical protein